MEDTAREESLEAHNALPGAGSEGGQAGGEEESSEDVENQIWKNYCFFNR